VTIGVKALKTLWGRAGGLCSICKKTVFEDDINAPDPTLIGENCHIVAEADTGPRADPTMPIEERNAYLNLILCCRNDHKIIDTQLTTYTVEVLHKIKGEHEAWVRDQLGLDLARQRDDEQYAGYVETWEQFAHLDDWKAWTSYLLAHGQPSLSVAEDSDLAKLRAWLIGRIWPGRYPQLEQAFANFHHVLQDLQELFRSQTEERPGSDELWTRKFYQIEEWNPERYQKLVDRFNYHVDLVQDLTLELTRAGNLICDRVREFLMPNYRIAQGRLVVQTGPDMSMQWHEFPSLYSLEEKAKAAPYPGLEAFRCEREYRDRHFGSSKQA
jgi:hypothetical protein